MTFKPGLHTLTVLGSLVFFQFLWPPVMAGAQDAITRAKLATVLVDRGPLGSGSGFCISPKGFFLTNAHVVKGLRPGKTVRLVLSPSTADERTLDARLVSVDEENDLALLQAAGANNLTSLPTGGASNLTETQPLTVLGYPFGRLLAYGGGYPSVSVGVTRVSALRKEDGELRAVQIDGAVNPGNSGGPVVNEKGQVVAVVVAGIPGSGVSFSIPSTIIEKFLYQPAVLIDLPECRYVDRYKPVEFGFESIALNSSAQPNAFELTIDTGEGPGKPIKLTVADMKRKKRIKLIEAGDDAAESVLLILRRGDETAYVPTVNHEVQVGSRSFSLLELRRIDKRAEGNVVMTAEGAKYLGAISGWTEDETAKSRGLLGEADRVDVYSLAPQQREVRCTLVALKAGKEVARVEDVLKFSGAPQVLKKDIVEKYLTTTGQGTGEDPFADLRATVAASRDTPETIANWEQQRAHGPPTWTVLEATSLTATHAREASEIKFERQADGSYLVSGPRDTVSYVFRARTPFPVSKLSAIRLETIPDERLPQGGAGRADNGNCVMSSFKANAIAGAASRPLPATRVTADYFQLEPDDGKHFFPVGMFDETERTGWAIGRDVDHPHQAVIELVPPADLDAASTELEVRIDQLYENSHSLGRFRISVTDAPRPVIVDDLPEAITQIVETKPEDRTSSERTELAAFFNNGNLRLRQAERELKEGVAGGGGHALIASLRAKIEKALDTPETLQRWDELRAQGLPKWTVLEATSLTATETADGATLGFERQEDGSYFVTGPEKTATYVFQSRLPFDISKLSGVRIELMPDSRHPDGKLGRTTKHNVVVHEVRIQTVGDVSHPLVASRATCDHNQRGQGGWPATKMLDGDNATGWALGPQFSQRHEAVIELAEESTEGASGDQIEISVTSQSPENLLGRFRISVTDSPRPLIIDDLPISLRKIANTPRDQRTAEQQDSLLQFFVAGNLASVAAEQELEKAIASGGGSAAAAALRIKLDKVRDTPDQIAEWEARRGQGLPKWSVLEATSLKATGSANAGECRFDRMLDGSYFVTGPREKVSYEFRCKLPFAASNLSALRLEAIPDERLPNRGSGRDSGNFVVTGIGINVGEGSDQQKFGFHRATTDFCQPGSPPTNMFDPVVESGWAIWGDVSSPHETVLETIPFEGDGQATTLAITIEHLHDDSHSLGRFRISVTDAPRPVVVDKLPTAIGDIVHTARDRRSDDQQKELLKFFIDSNVLVAQLEREIAQSAIPTVFPLEAFVDRNDPYAAPLDSFEIEAQIDASSAMIVTRHGVHWENNRGHKPGTDSPSGKFVKVNGAPWYVRWANNSAAVEGKDESELYRLPLGPAIWDYEVLSVTNAADGQSNPSRGAPEYDVGDDRVELEIDDNADGAGIYRVRFTRRK
jgi:hypothetical protein